MIYFLHDINVNFAKKPPPRQYSQGMALGPDEEVYTRNGKQFRVS